MEEYVRRLGIANIVYGVGGGLLALALLLTGGGVTGVYGLFDEPMLGVIVSCLTVMHLVTALPCVAGGFFLLRWRTWARTLLIVTSALNTLAFPFGTVVGVMGLWVLLMPEIEPLFSDTPASMVYQKRGARRPGNPSHSSRASLPVERYTPGQIE